jgi:DNA-binding CsgD family transcriptional regulator
MDHLLLVPLQQGVPESFLAMLRQGGWRVTVTSDILKAKQLLQKGDISGLMIEFSPAEHDPDRFKVLRFVHEFCPGTLVILLHSSAESMNMASNRLVQTLNTIDEAQNHVGSEAALELYQLSPAQKRIAALVAEAYPNREIARKLKIKEQSVRNELSRIFKKMGVWNRVELALLMRDGKKPHSDEPLPNTEGAMDGVWPSGLKSPAAGARPGVSSSTMRVS